MPLIVENGSGLANADSYISLTDARTLAANYGWILPDGDTEAEIALRNGAAYVDLWEPKFSGKRLNNDQSLAWPRVDAHKCYGGNKVPIDSDVVPNEIKKAQVAASVEFGAGNDPRPSNDGREIQEETVGPITQKYFQTGANSEGFVITSAVDSMRPLLCASTGGGLMQRTLRV